MGSPQEFQNGHMATASGGYDQRPQKATFSGLTALVGVVALVIDIISVAVPHWGRYGPAGVSYYASGKIIKSKYGLRQKIDFLKSNWICLNQVLQFFTRILHRQIRA